MKVILVSDEMIDRLTAMANDLERDGYRMHPATLRYLIDKATGDTQMTTADFDALIREANHEH